MSFTAHTSNYINTGTNINKLQTCFYIEIIKISGQWSPNNPEGKKKYEREFLMELKNDPQSRKKPENFPDWEAILKDTSNRVSCMLKQFFFFGHCK